MNNSIIFIMKLTFFCLVLLFNCAVYAVHEKGTQILGMGMNVLNMETYLPIYQLDYDTNTNNIDADSIIPDNVIEYVLPSNELSTHAVVIDQMYNYSDQLTVHLEGNTDVWIIKASFSGEYGKIATQVSQKNRKVAMVKSSVTLSMLTANINLLRFNPSFVDLIYRISYCIDKNTNNSFVLAKYYANQLVRTYGTHVIFKVLRGASVSQTITIDTNKLDNYNKETFKAEASAKLSSFFDMKGSYQRDTTQSLKYNSAITNVQISSHGGDPWHTDWKYNDWINTVKNNPAITEKYLIQITDLITPYKFFNTPAQNIQQALEIINDAISSHIKENTHRGCMDPISTSYSYRANLAASCLYNMKFTYGGSYQISSNPATTVNNMITQQQRCPDGFNSHALIPQATYVQGSSLANCKTVCATKNQGNPVGKILCVEKCKRTGGSQNTYTAQPFICLAPNMNTSIHGIYFGGAYSQNTDNVITGAKKCPDSYSPRNLYGSVTICEAVFDAGLIDAGVKSGGMFTSFMKNPYTNDFWCPLGYERHSLGNVLDGYEFVYCIGITDLTTRREFVPAGSGDPYPSFVEKYYLGDNEDIYYIVQIDVPQTYKEQVEIMNNLLKNMTSSNLVETTDNLNDQTVSSTANTSSKDDNPKILTWILAGVGITIIVLIAIVVGISYFYKRYLNNQNNLNYTSI